MKPKKMAHNSKKPSSWATVRKAVAFFCWFESYLVVNKTNFSIKWLKFDVKETLKLSHGAQSWSFFLLVWILPERALSQKVKTQMKSSIDSGDPDGDPDEMQHDAAFHQDLHCLLRLKHRLGTDIHKN